MGLEHTGDLLLSLLNHHFELVFFIVLGVGYYIGNIRIGSFSIGAVAGVLFVGLFFGHYGFRISTSGQMIGFALFIFSVGYQAGPGFVAVLKQDALKYFTLALVVALSGFSMAAIWAYSLSLPPGMSAGLLSGGLTSSPTLAAAQDAVHAGSVSIPTGWTSEQVVDNIAMGYALTYIFGLVGLIMMIKFLPKFVGIDVVKESEAFEANSKGDKALPQNILLRTYRITNKEIGSMNLKTLREKYWDSKSVVKVRRDGKFFPVDEDGLVFGDVIEVLGPRHYFTEKLSKIAKEVIPDWDMSNIQDSAQIVIQNTDIDGLSCQEVSIHRRFGLYVLSIHRKGKNIPYTPDTKLKIDDVITVTGTATQIKTMGEYAGMVEQEGVATDMVTLSLGIAIGLVIGMFSLQLGGVSVSLGSAGGLLASGLFIGYRRSMKPTFGQLPEPTRWFLMEFGLLLFMAGVGLRAGGGILETLQENGLVLVIAGICVTVTPILIGYFVGAKLLKVQPALIFGAITGAMTSGAALSVVIKEAKSPIPALGYTGTYAFANVLLVLAGSLIMIF
ncbi:MAG: hypothetical protein GQ531_06960 [Sulfurovum sp.]|nr:hypothetical protein [Sulfurovum sp.]